MAALRGAARVTLSVGVVVAMLVSGSGALAQNSIATGKTYYDTPNVLVAIPGLTIKTCVGCHFSGNPPTLTQGAGRFSNHPEAANNSSKIQAAFRTASGTDGVMTRYLGTAAIDSPNATQLDIMFKLALYIGQFKAPAFIASPNLAMAVTSGVAATKNVYSQIVNTGGTFGNQTTSGTAQDLNGLVISTAASHASSVSAAQVDGSATIAYNMTYQSVAGYAGADTFGLTVQNPSGAAIQTVPVTVYGVSSGDITAVKGVANSGLLPYTITSNDPLASGYAATVIAPAGSAGPLSNIGLSLNGSHQIIGPVTAAAGTYTIRLSVNTSNTTVPGNSGIAIKDVFLTVADITSVNPAAYTQNAPITPYQITSSPTATANNYTLSSTPAGLSFSTANGQLTGTPIVSGAYTLTMGATAGAPANLAVTKTLNLQVNSAGLPTISTNMPASTASSAGTINALVNAANYQVNVSRPSLTGMAWGASGLPNGLSVNGTGGIVGTPTQSGDFVLSLTGSNSSGAGTALAWTIRIDPTAVPGITSTPALAASPTVTGTVGTSITQIQINPSNGPITAGSYVATGLPIGLSADPNSGLITGTPLAGQSGDFTVVLKASNLIGQGSSTPVTIRINPNVVPVVTSTPALAASPTVTGTVGTNIAPIQINATNLPILVNGYSATGLPSGLLVNANTGLITGTPAAGQSGDFTVVLSAANAVGTGSAASVAIRINPTAVPVITSTPALSASPAVTGTVGTNITPIQINASNASITAGSYLATGLPGGLSADPNTGVISGAPTQSGDFAVVLKASNLIGQGSSSSVTIRINPNTVPVVTSTPSLAASPGVTGTVGSNITAVQINATNAPILANGYSVTGLPTGLSLDANTGLITGAPTQSGDFAVVLKAANVAGTGSAASVTIRINPNAVPVISGAVTVSANANQPFAGYQIIASNLPTLANGYSASGLPPGLTLNQNTGAITGIPTSSGPFSATLNTSNLVGTSGNFRLDFNIVPTTVPTVTAALQASPAVTGTVGGPITPIQINATNTPITGYSAIGLPSGLTVNGAGQIVGTPTQSGDFAVVPRATNASGTGSAASVTIRINPNTTPVVTSTPALLASPTVTGTVGSSITAIQINATNAPILANGYSATGLPSGLSLDANTGLITGVPTQSGDFAVVLKAANVVGTGSAASVTIRINPNATPVVTSTPALLASPGVTGTVGSNITAIQINATNAPILAGGYSTTGLPSGLSLDANTGLITGAPTQSGDFAVVLKAANAAGTGSTTSVTIRINPNAVPVVTSTPSLLGSPAVTGTVGSSITAIQINATNAPILAGGYSATGLPSGLSLDANTGLITGAPTQSGDFAVVLKAANVVGTGSAASVTIRINPNTLPVVTSTPALATSPATTGTVGSSITAIQINATNAPILANGYSATGLPPGLSLNANTGLITGAPTLSGDFAVVLKAANAAGTGSTTSVTVRINPAAIPVISSAASVSANENQPFAGYQIIASNLPILANGYNATGLPTGLTLDRNTGAITGTPTVSGPFSAAVTATNVVGTSGNFVVSFIIAPTSVPTVTAALQASPAATGTVGAAIAPIQINATNLPISAYAATGLPAGLTVNVSGRIVGTPTQSGDFAVVLSATNAVGTGSAASVTIRINPNIVPVISGATTATGAANAAFGGYQINASNAPILTNGYSASGLPPGLTLNQSTGAITGIPNTSGIFVASLGAANAAGTSALFALTFTINPSTTPGITSPTFASLMAGSAISPIQIVATHLPLLTNGYGASGLPNGLTVNPATGVISGTPATPGTFSATLTATNVVGPGSRIVQFTIGIPAPGACAMSVPLNTPTTLDLASCVFSGFAPTGVSIVATASHGAAVANGTRLTYTPVHNYFGADAFSFVASGAAGTSPQGVVTVIVTGRPDPTQDVAVVAVAAAQAEASQRFARAQISNFQRRMESLHRGIATTVPGEAALQGSVPGIPASGFGSASGVAAPATMPLPPVLAAAQMQAANAVGAAQVMPRTIGAEILASSGNMPSNALQAPIPATQAELLNAIASGTGLRSLPFADSVFSLLKSRSFSLSGVASGFGLNSPNNTTGNTSYWVEGVASFGTRDARGGLSGSEFNSSGVSVGADRRLSDEWVMGLGLGYARDSAKIGSDGSSNRSRAYSLAVYGSYQPSANTFVDGLLGVGSVNFSTTRFVAPINDFALGQRDGTQLFGSLTGGYEFRDKALLVSPYARIDFSASRLRDSTENGAGTYALTYFSQTMNSVQGALGIRGESVHATDFGYVVPKLRAEYLHEFHGTGQAFFGYADQIGGPRYALGSAGTGRNSIVLGIGSDFLMRDGLTLAFEYQLSRSSAHDSSYALRLRLTKEFDAHGLPKLLGEYPLRIGKPLDIQLDAGYTLDDNVTRAKPGADKLSDDSYSVNVSKTIISPLSEQSRLLLTGALGGEKFHRFNGLSRMLGSAEAEVQYRESSDFDDPTFGAFAKLTGEAYETRLRDGYRLSAGVSIRQAVTDRINVFAALSRNARNAKSSVFSTRDNSARINFDYALSDRQTLYLGGEYRRGDIVSTGHPGLENVSIAKVFAQDDAYAGGQLFSYRFEGSTVLATLGYNLAVGAKDSIDFSWRYVRSTPGLRPSFVTSPRNYIANQLSAVYLMRF